MYSKLIILAAAVAVARSSGVGSSSFAYDVTDLNTGDIKSQVENRVGHSVQGQYSLLDSDGTRRTVDYAAGPYSGFNAVVRKDPALVAAAPIAPAIAPVAAYAPQIVATRTALGYSGLAAPAALGYSGLAAPAALGYSGLAAPAALGYSKLAAPAALGYSGLAAPAALGYSGLGAPAAIGYSRLGAGVSLGYSGLAAPAALGYSKVAAPAALGYSRLAAPAALGYSGVAAPYGSPLAYSLPQNAGLAKAYAY